MAENLGQRGEVFGSRLHDDNPAFAASSGLPRTATATATLSLQAARSSQPRKDVGSRLLTVGQISNAGVDGAAWTRVKT